MSKRTIFVNKDEGWILVQTYTATNNVVNTIPAHVDSMVYSVETYVRLLNEAREDPNTYIFECNRVQ